MDDLREHAKEKKAFQYQPFKTALLTNPDAWEFTSRLLDEAKTGRRNVIYETALKSIDDVAAMITAFQAEKYAVDLHTVAVNSKTSILGIFERYERAITQRRAARFVDIGYHDAVYEALPTSIERLETSAKLDMVTVYRRTGERLYLNDGMLSSACAKAAIQQEQDRIWSDDEKNTLVKKWRCLLEQIEARIGKRNKPVWYVQSAKAFLTEAELFASSTQVKETDILDFSRIEKVTHHHIFVRPSSGASLICFDRRLHKAMMVPK